MNMARGIMSHSSHDISQQGLIPSSSNLSELEPWIAGGYDQAPSFASQYVTGDGGICGRRSTLRYEHY